MNIIPLNAIPKPGALKGEDNMRLMNMGQVYTTEKLVWYPNAGDAREGSRLYVHGAEPFDVIETRIEILRLLEGPKE